MSKNQNYFRNIAFFLLLIGVFLAVVPAMAGAPASYSPLDWIRSALSRTPSGSATENSRSMSMKAITEGNVFTAGSSDLLRSADSGIRLSGGGQRPEVSTSIVLSQTYGGGGNSGSTYTNDFIELFNLSNSSVDVTGWSVQYASAAGSTWQVTDLTGSIPAGGYYLVQEAQGAGGTTPLPTPDAIGTIAMAAGAGKVALVNNNVALTGTCPSGGIVDFVGYGTTANCFEGTGPAPAPSGNIG